MVYTFYNLLSIYKSCVVLFIYEKAYQSLTIHNNLIIFKVGVLNYIYLGESEQIWASYNFLPNTFKSYILIFIYN